MCLQRNPTVWEQLVNQEEEVLDNKPTEKDLQTYFVLVFEYEYCQLFYICILIMMCWINYYSNSLCIVCLNCVTIFRMGQPVVQLKHSLV